MAFALVFNRGGRQAPPQDSVAFGAIAERMRRTGDFESAVTICRAGLERFPSHVSARVTLGSSLLALGLLDEAREAFEHVVRQAPDNLLAIRGLAQLHGGGQSGGEYTSAGYSNGGSEGQPAGFWGGGSDATGARTASESMSRVRSRVSDEDEDYAHSVLALKKFEEEQAVKAGMPEPDPVPMAAESLLIDDPEPAPDEPLQAILPLMTETSDPHLPDLGDDVVIESESAFAPAEVMESSPVDDLLEGEPSVRVIVCSPLAPVSFPLTEPELLAYELALPCPATLVGLAFAPDPIRPSFDDPRAWSTLEASAVVPADQESTSLQSSELVDDLRLVDELLDRARMSSAGHTAFMGFDFFQEFQSEEVLPDAPIRIDLASEAR